MQVSSNQYYAQKYYPQQRFQGKAEQEKKQSNLLSTLAIAAGVGLVSVAGIKTHNINSAIKEAGIQSESKISLVKMFFRNLNFANWATDAEQAKSLIAKNYTQVGKEGRIFKSPQGDSFILLEGNKTIDVKTGKNVEKIEYQKRSKITPQETTQRPKTAPKATSKIINKSEIKLPEKLQESWDEAIHKIANQSTETAFIHDANTGEKLLTSEKTAFEGACCFDHDKLTKIVDETLSGKREIAMIHNHPFESTFSSIDIDQFYTNGYHSMAAVTRDGGFAMIQRKGKPLSTEQFEHAKQRILNPYMFSELNLNLKLLRMGKNNAEILENMNKWQNIQIPLIANILDSSYHYTPGKAKHIPSDESTKSVEKMIDSLAQTSGLSTKDYLKQIDETPLEQFFNPLFKD